MGQLYTQLRIPGNFIVLTQKPKNISLNKLKYFDLTFPKLFTQILHIFYYYNRGNH